MTRSLPTDLVEALIEAQLDTGAIASELVEGRRSHFDQNGFVTAPVLDAVSAFGPDERVCRVVQRGLEFLETCEAPARQAGTFLFWPPGLRPSWIPPAPPDADDTALIGWQLVQGGRRDRTFLRRVVLDTLVNFRVPSDQSPRPNWVHPGVFWTWLDAERQPNVVDCTVNANVVGVMAAAHLRVAPGYQQACEMIASAIVLAWEDEVLTRLLSPYYPHPTELLYAVRRAVARGGARSGGAAPDPGLAGGALGGLASHAGGGRLYQRVRPGQVAMPGSAASSRLRRRPISRWELNTYG